MLFVVYNQYSICHLSSKTSFDCVEVHKATVQPAVQPVYKGHLWESKEWPKEAGSLSRENVATFPEKLFQTYFFLEQDVRDDNFMDDHYRQVAYKR